MIEILSYDWNCRKFITPRLTADEEKEGLEPPPQRIAELDGRFKALGITP